MARVQERILLAWTGGKDSALALLELRRSREFEVAALVTCITEDEERVAPHGVSRDLLEAQARALDLKLEIAYVPKGCCNKTAIERLGELLIPHKESGVTKVAFGDLFLDDVRDIREEHLEALGLEAHFPLWQRCTKDLAYSFLQQKFKAVVTCVDEQVLDQRYVGRPFDRSFLGDLPLTVDPCGENGEFHTFVHDGPLFRQPVLFKVGNKYVEDHFHFCEITSKAPASVRRTGLARARSS